MYIDTVVVAGLLVVAATLIFGCAVAGFIINDNRKNQGK
ncbi:cytochrome c oxidase subunit CcoM [Endozoicomonas sp. 8E]|nr:cytochrome c oxidase subunit CcoM [Endozoicomonas sp. 8E]WOG25771.1 cytochrome c oxidase subunit CcoM [Endozoicomonas sp. 8E]